MNKSDKKGTSHPVSVSIPPPAVRTPAKPQSNPVGRPTKLTEVAIQKLEEAFALDCTDEEACFYADIAPSTLYGYQQKHPEFLERKKALRQRPVLLARQSIIKSFTRSPDLALKYLERKKKDEFSMKQEIEHSGETAVNINYVQPADKPTEHPDPANSEATPSLADTPRQDDN